MDHLLISHEKPIPEQQQQQQSHYQKQFVTCDESTWKTTFQMCVTLANDRISKTRFYSKKRWKLIHIWLQSTSFPFANLIASHEHRIYARHFTNRQFYEAQNKPTFNGYSKFYFFCLLRVIISFTTQWFYDDTLKRFTWYCMLIGNITLLVCPMNKNIQRNSISYLKTMRINDRFWYLFERHKCLINGNSWQYSIVVQHFNSLKWYVSDCFWIAWESNKIVDRIRWCNSKE